jgi:hypothetical protein
MVLFLGSALAGRCYNLGGQRGLFCEFLQDRVARAFLMSGGPLKLKFLVIVSLSCLLLVGPCYGKRRHSTTSQPVAQEQPAAPPPPPTLAQQPASAPQVSYQGGQLTISAQNSTLGDILRAVRAQTGATIELPGTASERVVGHFGQAPARDVLTELLNGSHFNYLLLGSPTDPGALDRVILMARSGSSAENNPQPPSEQASAYNQNVYAHPLAPMAAPMAPAPGGNTVVVEGTDAQEEATDDSTDATADEAQADDQTDQTDQTDDQTATDEQQQQQDGQQNVKTPEQLLQELQQRQQQLQQQGIQPGVPPGMRPGFPNPGVPGQPGDGTNTPPHN